MNNTVMTLPDKVKPILLVEDNPKDEALTIMAFEENAITNPIVVARDGIQALNYLFDPNLYNSSDATVYPELVLLDLKLPKVDGFEVLHRIRADRKIQTLPVVILTSSKEEEDMLESYRSGANAYVCKPVDFTEFSKAIKSLGLFWLLTNESPRVPLVPAGKQDDHGKSGHPGFDS